MIEPQAALTRASEAKVAQRRPAQTRLFFRRPALPLRGATACYPPVSAVLLIIRSNSIGSGNTMVELCSTAMSDGVCR